MRPTISYLNEKFTFYNHLCFGGQLPQPVIRLNNRVRSLGLTCTRTNRLSGEKAIWIEISVHYDLPECEIIDTLIHEMIHYKFAILGIKDSSTHGKYFKSEIARINRDYGIPVSIKCENTELIEDVVSPVVRYFCISSDKLGNRYITVVAKTKIFAIWDQSILLKGKYNCEWYVGKHKVLNRFPRCISLKLYEIQPEILKDLLGNSNKLIRDKNIIRPMRKE